MADDDWPENHEVFIEPKPLAIQRNPTPVAEWSFDPLFRDYGIASQHMPNRFHRWMQRVFLGVYWRQALTAMTEHEEEMMGETPENLEARINEAGRDRVFARARELGWEPPHPVPIRVWQEIIYEVNCAKNGVGHGMAAD